tara:strand:+ start:164589 stop:165158 length:570 start_codon:yes stop_codon:yes gene_type:complete
MMAVELQMILIIITIQLVLIIVLLTMSYTLLISYEKELKGFLMRRLGCALLVDDLYQNLAEKTLRRPTMKFENPRAYLFQSASNAVSDHYRAQACRDSYVRQAQMDADIHVDTKSPEQGLAATQTVEIIERALAELPLLTQKIFYLYRLDSLTHQAIAEQLGISRSTVERHLSKAIAHWKEKLNEVKDW